jgi:hypothetical protein
MQEGNITRVEVERDLLKMTGHVWVISPVEHWQGWKLESHDILGYEIKKTVGGCYEEKREGK